MVTGAVFGGILLGAAGLVGGMFARSKFGGAKGPAVEGFYANME